MGVPMACSVVETGGCRWKTNSRVGPRDVGRRVHGPLARGLELPLEHVAVEVDTHELFGRELGDAVAAGRDEEALTIGQPTREVAAGAHHEPRGHELLALEQQGLGDGSVVGHGCVVPSPRC